MALAFGRTGNFVLSPGRHATSLLRILLLSPSSSSSLLPFVAFTLGSDSFRQRHYEQLYIQTSRQTLLDQLGRRRRRRPNAVTVRERPS